MWPKLNIGEVFTETSIYYRFTPQKLNLPTDLLRLKGLKMVLEKSSFDLKIVSLILAKSPPFSPDFPDWKKFSKFSLIGGNLNLFPAKDKYICLWQKLYFFKEGVYT